MLLLVVFAVVLTETNLCEFLANHFREISEHFVQERFYGTSLDAGKFKLHGQTKNLKIRLLHNSFCFIRKVSQ